MRANLRKISAIQEVRPKVHADALGRREDDQCRFKRALTSLFLKLRVPFLFGVIFGRAVAVKRTAQLDINQVVAFYRSDASPKRA
jgi:hypothetical protein